MTSGAREAAAAARTTQVVDAAVPQRDGARADVPDCVPQDASADGYAELDAADQAALRARLQVELRSNTYNPDTGVVTVSDDRAAAIRAYSRFVRLWEDADPELQPRVETARRALDRLTGEATSP